MSFLVVRRTVRTDVTLWCGRGLKPAGLIVVWPTRGLSGTGSVFAVYAVTIWFRARPFRLADRQPRDLTDYSTSLLFSGNRGSPAIAEKLETTSRCFGLFPWTRVSQLPDDTKIPTGNRSSDLKRDPLHRLKCSRRTCQRTVRLNGSYHIPTRVKVDTTFPLVKNNNFNWLF